MPDRRPKVLLADSHPLLRMGLRNVLEPSFEVVGEAPDGEALLAAAAIRPPDLVLTEIALPKIDGVEVIRRLRGIAPQVRVIVLSFRSEPSWVQEAFAAGASAYLPKTAASRELELALHEVLAGRLYLSPALALAALARPTTEGQSRAASRRPGGELTRREHDIIQLVGRGCGNKEIAKTLGVSVTTVRSHLNRVYEKLGSANRVELALLAARSELPIFEGLPKPA